MKPLLRILPVVAVLDLVCLCGASSNDAGLLAWHLKDKAAVDSAGIFLDQLIEPDRSQPIPHLRLGAAPPFGGTLDFSRDAILRNVAKAVPALSKTPWSGAASVLITRRSRSLAEAELAEMLTENLQRVYVRGQGELSLRLLRRWDPVPVPDEPLALRVRDLPATGLSRRVILRFDLSDAQQRIGTWNVSAELKLWREVPVAREALRARQPLTPGVMRLQRMDVLSLRDPLPPDQLQAMNLELTTNLKAGQPLLRRSVRVRPAIRRGHLAEAIFQQKGFTISCKVQVLQDGRLGDVVRVRNVKSKREFFGIVKNGKTILVSET